VGLEQLQIWDPEFMFFYSEDAYQNAVSDPAWSELQAVKNGNCYTIPQQPIDFCFSPSVNRYLGIMWLGELMYPDEFDWNIKDEVFTYYKMFYHCDMTDELYDALMSPGHTLPTE
jgi:iron complex transport system substrate-binding protein